MLVIEWSSRQVSGHTCYWKFNTVEEVWDFLQTQEIPEHVPHMMVTVKELLSPKGEQLFTDDLREDTFRAKFYWDGKRWERK